MHGPHWGTARAEHAELGGAGWLQKVGGAEDECPVQAVVAFPGVLCREPVPVAKSPTPSPPSSSALSALWVRILGKGKFGLEMWVLRRNWVRGWLRRGI